MRGDQDHLRRGSLLADHAARLESRAIRQQDIHPRLNARSRMFRRPKPPTELAGHGRCRHPSRPTRPHRCRGVAAGWRDGLPLRPVAHGRRPPAAAAGTRPPRSGSGLASSWSGRRSSIDPAQKVVTARDRELRWGRPRARARAGGAPAGCPRDQGSRDLFAQAVRPLRQRPIKINVVGKEVSEWTA